MKLGPSRSYRLGGACMGALSPRAAPHRFRKNFLFWPAVCTNGARILQIDSMEGATMKRSALLRR